MPLHRTTHSIAVGIDMGRSGVKGASVDLATGALVGERLREATPELSTPEAVVGVVAQVLGGLVAVDGPIGVTFPGVLRAGVIGMAANLGASWIGVVAAALFAGRLARPVPDWKAVPGVCLIVSLIRMLTDPLRRR